MRENRAFSKGMADRRKLLHVSVDGWLSVEHDEHSLRIHCLELSLSHMIVEAPVTWRVGPEMAFKSIEVDGSDFELGGFAAVTHLDKQSTADGTTLASLEYIDFDIVAQNSLQTVFLYVVQQRNRDERPVMRFNWAFRNVAQLVAVCKTLLAEVDVDGAWTDAGPSELARAYLAGKIQNLSPAQRVMLEIVWKLWCGSLDLPEPAEALPETAGGSLLALRKAIARGPNGIDEWLKVEWH
jgi:hypothetical protein